MADCLLDDAIRKLLDIIREVHVFGRVVHCDLSLGNMYFLPDGNVRATARYNRSPAAH